MLDQVFNSIPAAEAGLIFGTALATAGVISVYQGTRDTFKKDGSFENRVASAAVAFAGAVAGVIGGGYVGYEAHQQIHELTRSAHITDTLESTQDPMVVGP